MEIHEQYMRRCLELACKGSGYVAPNPMVGSVLVHEGRIIGEGWHQQYGQAHAEVNCFDSVQPADRQLIGESTLYVSLEPCAHHGKTPPCAALVVSQKVKEVVVACEDPFAKVAGKGIAMIREAGIPVHIGVLEQEARRLNKRFFNYHQHKRPYITLKWAQSADGYIAPETGRKVMLSNALSQRWVHRMRSEEQAILVGYRTALLDNPYLTNRFFGTQQPLRMIIDTEHTLPEDLHIKTDGLPTIIYTRSYTGKEGAVSYVQLSETGDLLENILQDLYERGINSLIVEGGSKTLQSFIQAGLWDEAYCIETPVVLGRGTLAPVLQQAIKKERIILEDNLIQQYTRPDNEYL